MTYEREVLDLAAIRLLAHPLRQQIAGELRKVLGQSTGLTSYHLRELAKHGFVEEVPGRHGRRERWWRFVPKDRRVPPRSEQSPQMRAVLDEMTRRDLIGDVAEFVRAQDDGAQPGGWGDGLPCSFATIEVTADELKEFFEEYIALLFKYKRPADQIPPGARTVQARFFAFPEPATGSAYD